MEERKRKQRSTQEEEFASRKIHKLIFQTNDEDAQHTTCGWQDIPVEIGDLILCHAAQQNEHGQATAALIPFVCPQWRDRRFFWQPEVGKREWMYME